MAGKFEAKPNTGSIFNNDRKEQDSHPDRTGQGLIECPHCNGSWETWINGWLKKTKDGKPFLSLSFRPKDQQQGRSQGRPQQQSGGNFRPQQSSGGGAPQRDWSKPGGNDDVPFAPF